MSARNTVVRLLASRRAYQSSGRVLDAVDAVLAATRTRTGVQPDAPQQSSGLGRAAGEFDPDLALVTSAAAYQMSRHTTAAIGQRSLTEFLR